MIPGTSPDLEAWLCYLLVALIGFITAVRQVNKRLEGVGGRWLVFDTYLLLFSYMAIPLILFFALDWTGAIRDTSIFAAIIVAFSYDRYLAGQGSQDVKVPGALTSWWPSFLAWADEVVKRIALKLHENDKIFIDNAAAKIAKGEDGVFQKLENLARSKLYTVDEMEPALDKVEEENKKIQIDEKLKKERKVRTIFTYVKSMADFQKALKEEGIIGGRMHFWYARRGRMVTKLLGVLILLAVLTFIPVYTYFSQFPSWTDYYTWRLRKASTSQLDQYRASQNILKNLQTSQSPETLEKLAQLFRRPDLPLDRVNLILSVLVQNKVLLKDKKPLLAEQLITALRTSNSVVRFRIHKALLYLGQYWQATNISEQLKNWRPDDNESVTDIEERIMEWQKAFAPQG